jgi:hypothetical protein
LEEAGPAMKTDITADLTRIYSTSSTDGEILKTHSFSQTISTRLKIMWVLMEILYIGQSNYFMEF